MRPGTISGFLAASYRRGSDPARSREGRPCRRCPPFGKDRPGNDDRRRTGRARLGLRTPPAPRRPALAQPHSAPGPRPAMTISVASPGQLHPPHALGHERRRPADRPQVMCSVDDAGCRPRDDRTEMCHRLPHHRGLASPRPSREPGWSGYRGALPRGDATVTAPATTAVAKTIGLCGEHPEHGVGAEGEHHEVNPIRHESMARSTEAADSSSDNPSDRSGGPVPRQIHCQATMSGAFEQRYMPCPTTGSSAAHRGPAGRDRRFPHQRGSRPPGGRSRAEAREHPTREGVGTRRDRGPALDRQ